MGSHPFNLIIRFLLEMAALISAGIWGYSLSETFMKYVYAAGIPILMMTIWVVFNVPGDPSRSGAAPVVVPGFLRLILELLFFGFAVWALYKTGYPRLGLSMGIVVALHYLLSYDRIAWLLSQ